MIKQRLGSRSIVWALSVGVVLADSSIVTLALPEVLREYDTSVFGVSWVLTACLLYTSPSPRDRS